MNPLPPPERGGFFVAFGKNESKNAEIKSVLMMMKHHDVKNIEMADYIVNNFDELYSLIKNLNS